MSDDNDEVVPGQDHEESPDLVGHQFDAGTASEETPDPALLREQMARDAAGDLARMGIDPRSLGLGVPATPAESSSAASDQALVEPQYFESGGSVVPLRPHVSGVVGPGSVSDPAPVEDLVQSRPPSEVESRLAIAPPAPSGRETGRFMRSIGRGLVTADAALTAQSERDLVDMVRLRQSDRRVVTFLSGKGGVGCTTVAVGVGTTFMALREDRTVLIDVQSGTPSLGHSQHVGETVSVSGLLQELEVIDPPLTSAGLGLIDGAAWDDTVTRSSISGVLDRLGEQHVFHLMDAGNDPGEGGHSALARADQIVLVTGPGQLGAYALGAAMERIQTTNPAVAGHVLHVVVCQSEEAHKTTQREVGATAGVVVIGPDPALLDGNAFDPAKVTSATRGSILRIAAAIARGTRPR